MRDGANHEAQQGAEPAGDAVPSSRWLWWALVPVAAAACLLALDSCRQFLCDRQASDLAGIAQAAAAGAMLYTVLVMLHQLGVLQRQHRVLADQYAHHYRPLARIWIEAVRDDGIHVKVTSETDVPLFDVAVSWHTAVLRLADELRCWLPHAKDDAFDGSDGPELALGWSHGEDSWCRTWRIIFLNHADPHPPRKERYYAVRDVHIEGKRCQCLSKLDKPPAGPR